VADIGIRLIEKTDSPKDIDKIIEEINKVISIHGLKIVQWGDWHKFRKACVDEQKFLEEME